MQTSQVYLTEHPTVESNFADDVIQGLSKNPKSIPPKYFYDAKGSQLFEAITTTNDYYPTRTELEILKVHANDIASYIEPGCILIEPGGANFSKVRLLLSALRPSTFIPADISTQHLRAAAEALAKDYGWLKIHALGTDFVHNIDLPENFPRQNRLCFFPGSSIGNFNPEDAMQFLATIAKMLGPNGNLLIGVDLKKDSAVLNKAYNDSQGYTAAFNLNLLNRINQELEANFNLDAWSHHAFYNSEKSRIEMHLSSKLAQSVMIKDYEFSFEKDETIHTENSYKYTTEEFTKLVSQSGYQHQKTWLDENNLFSVNLYSVVSS